MDSVQSAEKQDNANSLGRVDDLRLDEELLKKSIDADKENSAVEEEKRQNEAPLKQARRIEQVALPIPQSSPELPGRDIADCHVVDGTWCRS